MPRTRTRSAAPSPREVLVALAGRSDLGRPAFYRLAEELPAFLKGIQVGKTAGQLASGLGLPAAAAEKALAALPGAAEAAGREQARAAKLGARIVTRLDPEYPAVLAALPLAPPVLWLKGELPAGPALAVVGSRRADSYGKETAELLARELAAAGVAIVSGFARGVDAAAHRGALAATAGRTVAVLGCGLGVDYPRGHRRLGEEIAARGAVVGEFPCGWPARYHHFPIRNRLIAALAAGTLVVQAAPRSGSLITARHALELGREVLAVPGGIFDEKALGPNSLLRDGACLVRHPRDVLEALWPELLDRPAGAPAAGRGVPPGPAGELLAAMPPAEEIAPEAAAARARRPVAQALAELLELELGGWVRRLPGPAYVRVP